MRKIYTESKNICLSLLFLAVLFSSCASTKKTKYFQDIPDSGRLTPIARALYVEPKIQNDDILTVIIQTVDPQASAIINSGNVSGANNGTGNNGAMPTSSSAGMSLNAPNLNSPLGYLVDKEGSITIPVLGKIKLAGLTTTEARAAIQA